MKRLLLFPILFALAGCATFNPFAALDPSGVSILHGGSSIVASVDQPIGPRQMAVIESAYRTAIVGAVNYRRYCYSAPIESLPGVCANRRNVVLAMQSAKAKVLPVLQRLRTFVRNNQTVSAASAFAEVRAALADFQNLIPAVGAP